MHTLCKDWEEPDPVPPGENSLTPAERESLVLANLGLARQLAGVFARLDSTSDADDLYGESCLAITEAARRWHPVGSPGNPTGIKFGTYASIYLRRRLTGRVIDATPRNGRAVVRGLDMGTLASRVETQSREDYGPDDFDRELLVGLNREAIEVVHAVVFEGITAAEAAVRFNRPEKDISLIIRNALPALKRRRKWLDLPDLFDTADEPAAAEAGAA